MNEKTNWQELIGERVIVKMSLYATGLLDRIVTDYKYNFVYFDNETTGYGPDVLTLDAVYRSKKYPYGHIWTNTEIDKLIGRSDG